MPERGYVLDDRKLAVLRAIVQDYVSTMEPVGSKSLVDRLSGVKPLSAAERRAIETFLAGAYDVDDVVTRTVRLLAQLTRQVAVVQYPSLTRSSIRHVELVPLAAKRLLLVLITDIGRVQQRMVELPAPIEEDAVTQLRAVINACLDGRMLTEVASVVADLPERVQPSERPNAAAVFSVILESLVERNEEKVVVGGASNLTPADFSQGLHEVLESLEEQVVLMRLLGESVDQSSVTVRIGAENPVVGLHSTSLVVAGYGSGDQAVARLGVLGPTRMDYPTAMGAVRAVARYVGQIVAGT